jgi:hypothetical protein
MNLLQYIAGLYSTCISWTTITSHLGNILHTYILEHLKAVEWKASIWDHSTYCRCKTTVKSSKSSFLQTNKQTNKCITQKHLLSKNEIHITDLGFLIPDMQKLHKVPGLELYTKCNRPKPLHAVTFKKSTSEATLLPTLALLFKKILATTMCSLLQYSLHGHLSLRCNLEVRALQLDHHPQKE